MGRVLAVDFGVARCGLAISDERKIIAQPLATLPNNPHLLQKLKEFGPFDTIVIGLPLHMSGKESPMSQQARAFGALLQKEIAAPLIFWDERLTSLQAERLLKEDNLSRKKRSEKSDSLAAVLILQSYLSSIG